MMLEEGFRHITDLNGYDHILFLLALTAPYAFRDWKRLLILVTVFTLGHSITLFLSAYGFISLNSDWIEFLIPVTILITALYNSFFHKKTSKITFDLIMTLLFGFIHGAGFSNYLKMLMRDNHMTEDIFLFNVGLEMGQIIIVLCILAFGWLMNLIPGVNQKYVTYTFNFLAIIISGKMIWEKWFF